MNGGAAGELHVLFRDPHLIAVNKPHGLLVHRSAIDRHETRFALQTLRDQIGQRVYPVHRLDKPASGVLLFALSAEAARGMRQAFADNGVDKTYLAVVRGYTTASGVIDYALQEQWDEMTDARADRDKAAQPAVTAYHRLATAELPCAVRPYPSTRYSLLQVSPRTGRKHQIRRHMKHIFHPVIGDTTHGDGHHNRFFRARFGCERLLLAATRLEFTHPYTGASLSIAAPLDEMFRRVVTALGWEAQISEAGGRALTAMRPDTTLRAV